METQIHSVVQSETIANDMLPLSFADRRWMLTDCKVATKWQNGYPCSALNLNIPRNNKSWQEYNLSNENIAICLIWIYIYVYWIAKYGFIAQVLICNISSQTCQ